MAWTEAVTKAQSLEGKDECKALRRSHGKLPATPVLG